MPRSTDSYDDLLAASNLSPEVLNEIAVHQQEGQAAYRVGYMLGMLEQILPNPKPSSEDLKVTEDIEAAGKLIGLKLLDHIVVAKDGCISIIEYREKRSLIG